MSHDHDHASTDLGRLRIALAVTGSILGVEAVGAVITNSLTLLVDAAHMLTDSLGLLVALVAAHLMRRPASKRLTWGWKRMEVLAAAIQASILLVVGCYAVIEGVQRLVHPPVIAPRGLLVVGALGLLGNVISLLVLAGGRDHNLNMRAAFLEVAADALGSVAVMASAVVVLGTGWTRADAVAGLLVAALIIPRAVVLLRRTALVLLESAPEGLDLDAVRAHILGLPHVVEVHDLHASVVGTGLPVLTAHVVLTDECFTDGHSQVLLEQLHTCLTDHHEVSIEHSTFQLESRAFAERHVRHLHA